MADEDTKELILTAIRTEDPDLLDGVEPDRDAVFLSPEILRPVAEKGNIQLFRKVWQFVDSYSNFELLNELERLVLQKYRDHQEFRDDLEALKTAIVNYFDDDFDYLLAHPHQEFDDAMLEDLIDAATDFENYSAVDKLLGRGFPLTEVIVERLLTSPNPRNVEILLRHGFDSQWYWMVEELWGRIPRDSQSLLMDFNDELRDLGFRLREEEEARRAEILAGRAVPRPGVPRNDRDDRSSEEKEHQAEQRRIALEREQKNELLRQSATQELIRQNQKEKGHGQKRGKETGNTVDQYCSTSESLAGEALFGAKDLVMIYFYDSEKPAECYLASELRQTWENENPRSYLSEVRRENWESTDQRVYRLPYSGKYLTQKAYDMIFNTPGEKSLLATKVGGDQYTRYGRLKIDLYSTSIHV